MKQEKDKKKSFSVSLLASRLEEGAPFDHLKNLHSIPHATESGSAYFDQNLQTVQYLLILNVIVTYVSCLF